MNHTRHACFPHAHFLKYTQEHDIHNTTHTHVSWWHSHVPHCGCGPGSQHLPCPSVPGNAICLKSDQKLVFSTYFPCEGNRQKPAPCGPDDFCTRTDPLHHAPPDCLWPVCLQEKPQLCCVCGHVCVCTCAGHRLTSDVIRQVPSTLYFETGFWFYLQCTSSARLGGK